MALYNSNGRQKDDESRQRKNAPVYDKTQIEWDGVTRGPDLPENYTWCDRTQEWWDMWRNSPNSMVMRETDWETLLEAALIHNLLWSGKNLGGTVMTNLMSELRRRVACFGATFEDRMKLRMSIETPQSEQETEKAIVEEAASAIDYAERLAKEAAESG